MTTPGPERPDMERIARQHAALADVRDLVAWTTHQDEEIARLREAYDALDQGWRIMHEAAEQEVREQHEEIARLRKAKHTLERLVITANEQTKAAEQRVRLADKEIDKLAPTVLALEEELTTVRQRVQELEECVRGLLGSAVEFDDERVGYIVMQVDRCDIDAARAVLTHQDEEIARLRRDASIIRKESSAEIATLRARAQAAEQRVRELAGALQEFMDCTDHGTGCTCIHCANARAALQRPNAQA